MDVLQSRNPLTGSQFHLYAGAPIHLALSPIPDQHASDSRQRRQLERQSTTVIPYGPVGFVNSFIRLECRIGMSKRRSTRN